MDGARDLRRTLKEAGGDLSELKAANRAAADVVAAAAITRAPKRTGRLASAIRPGASQRAGTVKYGRKAVPYAGPIQWGWPARGLKGTFYVTKAAAETESTWIAAYVNHMNKTIEKVHGK